MPQLTVRELETRDIATLSDYWFQATPEFLTGMGVDLTKMPTRAQWEGMLEEQIRTPITSKQSYCIIWELDGQAVGHCNVNRIIQNQEAYMHLHIWDATVRRMGLGVQFVQLTLPRFFEALHLQVLYCEPYALNPAPNKTLEKIGFRFDTTHITIPGFINFEQPVNRWMMTHETLTALNLL
jgi:RimJ/RimL family protein N-acetyltransferase